ncbi:class I SAM-dependent methyltransferase [Streptomyces malaysiense]|uniref:Methyltransferase n=1 Tax=Streptomyces malaysiense TaxID=1428626 RepID=A0A1J4PTR6_9ACTN|nr:class I SAM-dependent methyltransferase [Streptomyces malaysiense]OIK23359.1 methyltransferase [Streptomyces malaysiense]
MTTTRPADPGRAARAHSFNAAAAQYAANRPSYPSALFDTIEQAAGRPLAGARTADVGAGTGISTGPLRARGADVLAVEPGEGMAAEFRRGNPDIPLVRGDGNALPLADATLDLLTYAQSWHWTDPAHSVTEALRVLRPGGTLALWWNTHALDVEWIAQSLARRGRYLGFDPVEVHRNAHDRTDLADPSGRLDFAEHTLRWSRRIPVDAHLANIASHSHFLVMDAPARDAFLAEERTHLLEVSPDGTVEETYDVLLLVARKP